jgi:nicotinate-nucleotide adenylyltransferase
MVEAAVAPIDGLEASAVEVEREGASVTADTIEALARPDRELHLLLGADAVANMSTWRRLEETKALATVAVIERAGEHADPPGAGWMVEHVTIPRLDVSSTEVRERCANGIPIDGLVPLAVVRMIADRGLYAGRR